MPLTGDDGKLSALIAQLASADRIPAELREPLAKRALELVRQGFDRGTSPLGVTWKALVDGTPSHLKQSGTLKGSLAATVTGTGFELTADTVYAAIHQYGGEAGPQHRRVKIPKRPYLPDGEALSYTWERAFQVICDDYVRRHFGQ